MTIYDHALISEPTIDKCMAELNRTSLNGYKVVAAYAVNVPGSMPSGSASIGPLAFVRHYCLIRKPIDPS